MWRMSLALFFIMSLTAACASDRAPATDRVIAADVPTQDTPAAVPVSDRLAPAAATVLPVFRRTELDGRAFAVVHEVSAHACTINPGRPLNTGDPAVNPPERRAVRQLLLIAKEHGADAVIDLRCANEMAVSFGCFARVACSATAIRFETAGTD